MNNTGSPEFVGPYQLLTRIGEGGMGVVHLALDSEGRAVAVKVLRPHVAGDASGRERLAREVRAMRRVRGPHVAEVLEADVDADLPYLVTRYVPGRPLDALIGEHGPLPVHDLLRLGHGLADALACMHHAGVVHRDLKPSNVLLADGVPVVIDFGIAQLVDETRLTSTGLFLGTPGYFAAEVARGEPASPASDIASWAATVAYAATGRSPYGHGPLEVVLANITSGTVDLDGVPDEIAAVIRPALDTRPERRPTAWELRSELDARLERLTVPAGRFGQAMLAPTETVSLGPPAAAAAQYARGADVAQWAPAGLATSELETTLARPPVLDPPASEDPFGPAPWDEPGWGGAARGPRRTRGEDDDAAGAAASWRDEDRRGADEPNASYPVEDGHDAGITAPRGGWLVGVGLFALLAAGTAVAPLLGLVALAVVLVLLHTADGVGSRLDRRRATQGRRRSDHAVAVGSLPLHLVLSLGTTVVAFIVAGVVATVFGGTASLLARNGTSGGFEVAATVGGIVFVLVTWIGPGSRGVRGGNARLSARLGSGGRAIVGVLLLAVALGAAGVAYATPADWWPAQRPVVHQFDSVRTQLPHALNR